MDQVGVLRWGGKLQTSVTSVQVGEREMADRNNECLDHRGRSDAAGGRGQNRSGRWQRAVDSSGRLDTGSVGALEG